MSRSGRVLTTLLLATGLVPPAAAYDGDTHYAWTYYVALHVGFSPRQAYQIASGAWAVDHDPQTGPLHAEPRDAVFGSPDPAIERVWRRFHAFADAVYVGTSPDVTQVAARRAEGERTLADLAGRERNPGPWIHYVQDAFAHGDYDSVRGHAVWGHVPDRIGHRPSRGRTMTRRTVAALTEFAPVVGVTPRAPDEERLFAILDRLAEVNPPLLQVEPANYDIVWDALAGVDVGWALQPGQTLAHRFAGVVDRSALPRTVKDTLGIRQIAWGDVDLAAAVAVVNRAVAEDVDALRLPRYPADWVLPAGWIQYDFDADGAATAETRGRRHFEVERIEIAFGPPEVTFRRDPASRSLYEVTARQPYTISGLATLPPFRTLAVVERSLWSDDGEQRHVDRDRGNGTHVLERKVFRPRVALLDGSLAWTPSVAWPGQPVLAAPPVSIRLGADRDFYVVALSGTGFDLVSEGVATGRGPSPAGLHRRRGGGDLLVVKVERGQDVAAVVAELRRAVEEPACRRPASLPASETVEAPGASLDGLPAYWDDLALTPRGPFASAAEATAALRASIWQEVAFEPTPNLDAIRFRSGCEGAMPPALVAVPDVRELPFDQAETRLRAAGLAADLVGGGAPRTPAEQYTIERQEPAPGGSVARGSTVRVAVRPGYVEPSRLVPALLGLPAAQAEQALRAAGLVAEVVGGDPAPDARRAFTVQDQRPAAGAGVPAGTTVVVRIHSAFDTRRTVPDVVGLPAADAERRLRDAGFVAQLQGGDPAPGPALAFSVQSQQPGAGAALAAGSAVALRVHSAFAVPPATPPPPPTVEPGGTPICPPFGSRTAFRAREGAGSALCEGYRHAGREVTVSVYWAAARGTVWGCGAAPAISYQVTAGPIRHGYVFGTISSETRVAVATVAWFGDETPLAPELIDLARRALALWEVRGGACTAGGPPPGPPPHPPHPVRPPPPPQTRPAGPGPTSDRPPCTCVDAQGRRYRMMFGDECDPTGSMRTDDCS